MAGETSGISNKIQVLKETAYDDGGEAGEKVFGVTKSFSWRSETTTVQSYGLETDGPQATVNIDGVLVFSGTHEFELTTGKVFEAILGDITGDDVRVTKVLPSYAVKAVDEGGETERQILISGIKYSKFSVNIARGSPITVTADWVGRKIVNTGTFNPTEATVEPLIAEDAYILTGTAPESGLDNVTLEIDRGSEGVRFLEATTSGNRRLISKVIEKILAITANGAFTGQRSILEKTFGSTTIQDLRTDENQTIKIKRGDIEIDINLTGARTIMAEADYNKENDLSLINFDMIAKNVEIDAAD